MSELADSPGMPKGVVIAGALAAGAICVLVAGSKRPAAESALEGADPEPAGRVVPAIEAAFEFESYRPGERAMLVIENPTKHLTVQILRSGPERVATHTDLEMNGVRVTSRKQIGGRRGRTEIPLTVGRWPSGLYFARLEETDGRVGHAPFVVGPRWIGERRVAVVLPTLTWQAYNFRDDDGDGLADSWYAGKRVNSVRLGRPHLDRGVPYGFRYHLGFLNWLAWTHRRVDYLSQLELERVSSPETLARAYDLMVFAGHHEYVTEREYDLVEAVAELVSAGGGAGHRGPARLAER